MESLVHVIFIVKFYAVVFVYVCLVNFSFNDLCFKLIKLFITFDFLFQDRLCRVEDAILKLDHEQHELAVSFVEDAATTVFGILTKL